MLLGLWVAVGEQLKPLPRKIPGIMKEVWFAFFLYFVEVDGFQECAFRIVNLGQAVDPGLVHHGGQETYQRMHGHDVIENPPVIIALVPLPAIAFAGEKPECAQIGLDDLVRQDCILVVFDIKQEIPDRFGVGAPIRRKYRIHRKALEDLVIAKHITEEFVSLFNAITLLELVVDDADPGADAR